MGRRAERDRGPPAVDCLTAARERGRPPRGVRRLPGAPPPPPPILASRGERGAGAGARTTARVLGPGRPLGNGPLPAPGPGLSAELARRGDLDRRLALAGRS